MRRPAAIIVGALLLLGSFAQRATALPTVCSQFSCQGSGDGMSLSDRRESVLHHAPGDSAASKRADADGTQTETTVTPGCPGNDPNVGGAYDMACAFMTSSCALRGLGDGWLTWIWTRTVPASGSASGSVTGSASRWRKTGFSCHVPRRGITAGRPALTRALIQRAFARLPFAHPRVHIQPEGNVTLVNLPTYYQVRWPNAGYRPGQIATVALLGRTVRIRPSATYTYEFGDGNSTGPTADLGGTYPGGRIRHTYTIDATVPVRAQAQFTGEYDTGGGWEPIDITVPVDGAVTQVRVKRARTHLLAGSD